MSSSVSLSVVRGSSRPLLVAQRQRGPTTKTSATRRLLSSLTAAVPPPQLPPKRVGALVSRRQWKKLFKPPPRKPPTKDGSDEKPWPRSVQILGYGLATTVAPYCIAWYIATNVTIRNMLEPYVPGMVPVLRKLFGAPEEGAVSYVDKREEGANLVMPLSLDMEPNTKSRKEQEALDALLHDSTVPTRLRVFTHGGFNLGEVVDLPGTTAATSEALVEVLMKDRNQTIDPESVSHVTVEFANVKDGNRTADESDNGDGTTDGLSGDPVLEVHMPSTTNTSSSSGDDSSSDLSAHVANLTKTTATFSSWHYQPVLQPAQQAAGGGETKSQGASMTQDEVRTSELEYMVEQFEKQLKDHTTMRDLDDLNAELGRAKGELRRLRWKRRLRIFG